MFVYIRLKTCDMWININDMYYSGPILSISVMVLL